MPVCQSLFVNKLAGLRLTTLLKKRLRYRCFSVIFVKFLKTPFLQVTVSHNMKHCVKNVRMSKSYSGQDFPVFRISPYSVRMRENADQKNSEYGHFLRIKSLFMIAVGHSFLIISCSENIWKIFRSTTASDCKFR